MLDEKLQKLLDLLKDGFQKDIIKTIESLSTKIKLDVYPKIVEIIETDDAIEVQKAKQFLTDSTKVLINDLEKELKDFLYKY